MRCHDLTLLAVFAAALTLAASEQAPQSGSTPQERPRTRPPSELTGWADWEKADTLLARIKIPPAPALDPDAALKTFRLAPGYRIELVAAEPMVNSPIFFEFDPDGRIWVVEYQGYMRDLQGRGEGDPICRVVVLEDTNADGRADRSTVFLDGLVMPRSLAFVKGGVLVAEPPNLWFCEDTNGDLRCDRKTRVGTYGVAGNPQHTANGLRYGIDNWLHSADIAKRHRFADQRLIEQDTILRGQFGVTFDDEGRFLTSRENRALIGDLIPAEYVQRNPALVETYRRSGGRQERFGINLDLAVDEAAEHVFPVRATPAVTLGALELREDGRLRTYTVVSGTSFYNGHQFPADAYGNVFVPESGGHLVGRLKLEGGIELRATRFYPDEQEFLTSTDERFRPVNSRVGPDGALYIADMYHGIIEHVIFMVPYLEKQIRERRLDEGLDKGRIYRVIHEGNPIDRRPPRLAWATASELVSHLSHDNGWWRLTAQRLLVERRDTAAIPPLRELARTGARPLGRLHALWTLQGMQALDWPLLLGASADEDDRVRAAAVRLCEHLEASAPADRTLDHLERLAADRSSRVRLQVALTAGSLQTKRGLNLLAALLEKNDDRLFRAAIMTGLQGRELEFLSHLTADRTATPSGHIRETMRWIAETVLHEGRPERIEQVLALADTLDERRAMAMRDSLLEGMAAAIPRQARPPQPIEIRREPLVLTRLLQSSDDRMRTLAWRLHGRFTWPGAPALRVTSTDARPLSPADMQLAARGRETYMIACAACHQPDGGGVPNVAPPLAGSDWVAGPGDRLIRVVLHGLYGPIHVNGVAWNLHMPGLGGALDDGHVAGVLTYVRRAWGNLAESVQPAEVAAVRAATATRTIAWSAKELSAGAPGIAAVAADAVIRPGADAALLLPARLAIAYGQQLAYRPSLDVLAPWRHEHDVAEWRVHVDAGGRYQVLVTLAADEASAGDRFVVETERSRTSGLVQSSGGYATFHEYAIGSIELAAGVNRIVMRPDGPLRRELADVRSLRLAPISRQP
jgi:mono/diheme cytochrome c family protein/glucose/arabinose dehydrogenase